MGHASACTYRSPMLTSSTVQVPEVAATVEEQEGRVRQTHGQATERCMCCNFVASQNFRSCQFTDTKGQGRYYGVIVTLFST